MAAVSRALSVECGRWERQGPRKDYAHVHHFSSPFLGFVVLFCTGKQTKISHKILAALIGY